ncbi:MAG: enhanced serine sensitivity protein SseB C-terminal domain-containing protein [Methylacidiphilales bacterium]|nr:enhanced serine sensitivity protein SseB C-terminal domain-containing protein [Candidatus Methylacidiphilales bacterium]
MSERSLPRGTKMFFGAPAKPIPEVLADALGQVVAQVDGICEAYISQTFIEGDSEARQVLVVGVEKKEKIPEIMNDLMGKMKLLLRIISVRRSRDEEKQNYDQGQ